MLKSEIENEKLLTLKEAAERLRVTTQTIETYIQKGMIGCFRIGGRIFISEQNHLRPFLKRCEQPAAA